MKSTKKVKVNHYPAIRWHDPQGKRFTIVRNAKEDAAFRASKHRR